MADFAMPDLSNLTEEERRQIEDVINRQKHEEAKDKEVVQNLANEVKQIEQRVILQKSQQPFGGLIPDPNKEGLCDICQKVKFADGIGHQCNYCRLHSCQRCGGRVPIKNGKFTWVCSLCKKKQELLKKTGQWYHGNTGDLLADCLISPNAPSGGAAGPPIIPHNGSSAGPISRQQASLQRQKSHDPSAHHQQPMSPTRHRRTDAHSALSESQMTQLHRQQSMRRRETVDQPGLLSRDEELRRQGPGPGRASVIEKNNGQSIGSSRRDSSRTRSNLPSRRLPGDPFDVLHAPTQRRPDSQGGARGRGYVEASHPIGNSDYPSATQRAPLRRAQSHDRYGSQDYVEDYDPRRGGSYDAAGGGPSRWQEERPAHLAGAAYNTSRTASSVPAGRRYASVEDRRRTYQQNSFSSEDDLQSNISEFTMADDGASLRSYSSEQSTRTHPDLRHVNNSNSRPNNRRMWRQSSHQEQGYYSQEGYSISGDPRPSDVSWRPSNDGRRMIGHIVLRKDNFNEMAMGRSMNCAAALGLRIEGGKMTHSGRLAAFIVRVKRGSVAEVMGQLRAGDEVLEWNAVPLRGLTFQEVYDIIEDSRNDSLMELMVSRKASADYRQSTAPHYFRSEEEAADERRFSPQPSLSLNHQDVGGNGGVLAKKAAVPYVSGRIQVSFYYSHSDAHLAVTVIQAAALLPRPDGSARNAYAKLYLLPNRSEQTKRRTKIISKTNDPQWQQIFYYAPLKESELQDLTLEIMVWDYERYKQTSNEFIGEVLIGLASDWRNDCPAWYYLTYPDTGLDSGRAAPQRGGYEDPDFNTFSSMDGLSPANSSISRLSDIQPDNYLSDVDYMEGVDRRKQRPSAGPLPPPSSRYLTSSPRLAYPGPGAALVDYSSPSESARQIEGDHQHSRQSPHALHYDTNRLHERRGRREVYDEVGPHEDVRHARSNRRHLSAPPVADESFYLMDDHGSPSGSHASSMASARKRQLPVLPNNTLSGSNPAAGLSVHTTHGLSTSRRASLSQSNKQGVSSDDQLLINMPLHAPSSPSAGSRHSQSKAPIMQQLHNQTLKVPGSEDDPSLMPIVGNRHPKLDQLLKNNSSQEENIDPHHHPDSEQQLVLLDTRHSRSSSRRSLMRKPSASLSRSSEPTDGDLTLLVPNSDNRNRKLSESLPRLQSLDLDDANSEIGGGAMQKSVSNTDVFQHRQKKFDYDEFQSKFLEQQSVAKDRKTKSSAKAAAILGLKKDSKRPTFSRSEEVGHQSPASIQRALLHKQMSKDSTDGSVSSSGYGGNKNQRIDSTHLASFVDGLGPGQVVGRQVLAMTCLGEIQLHIKFSKGNLEVEVVRAKGLVVKTGSRQLPATYVKVYIMEEKRVWAKQKTNVARRSLDPLYQQVLVFDDQLDIEHRTLQVSVWGDFGRMEKKLFMGIALINLDELDLSTIIIGWYKLFDSATVLTPATKSSLYAASVSGAGSNNSSMEEKSLNRPSAVKN